MYRIRYVSDLILLTLLLSILMFWASSEVSYQVILLIMALMFAIVLLDIGANTNGRILIKVATMLFKLVDGITLKIIGLSKSGVNKVKASK